MTKRTKSGRVDQGRHQLAKEAEMPIEAFGTFAAVILAISLAAERLVTILKTCFPSLAEEKTDDDGTVDPEKDKWRRLGVWAIAFVAGCLTAAFLATDSAGGTPVQGWNLFGDLPISEGHTLPVVVVGFLASGGSALWANLVGFSKELKDAQRKVNKKD
jgi:hypothetical protein